jgi:hypothetical protein
LSGVISHDRVKPVEGRSITRNAPQKVATRPVGDILVQPQLAPFLREQKLPVRSRKNERRLAKEQDLAALEHFAIGASLRSMLVGPDPAIRQVVIFDRVPANARHGCLHMDLSSGRSNSSRSPIPENPRSDRFPAKMLAFGGARHLVVSRKKRG